MPGYCGDKLCAPYSDRVGGIYHPTIRYFHRDTWVVDDGEMLVALRTTLAMHQAEQAYEEKLKAARSAFATGDLPPIQARKWLNADHGLDWDVLKGKVVLLDFWATWCGPCIAKLPEVQQLHEELESRGLVVIGIHSANNSDDCERFVTNNTYTFPIAIDSGVTADGFAINGLPAYFLFDRSLKLVKGFESELPDADTIEQLLAQ